MRATLPRFFLTAGLAYLLTIIVFVAQAADPQVPGWENRELLISSRCKSNNLIPRVPILKDETTLAASLPHRTVGVTYSLANGDAHDREFQSGCASQIVRALFPMSWSRRAVSPSWPAPRYSGSVALACEVGGRADRAW